MPLDHSKANVTVSIAGIAISRPFKRNQYEVDLLRCDRHKPALDIQVIKLDPVTGKRICSFLKTPSVSLAEDISIDVVYPDKDGHPLFQRGVSTYMDGEFNRLKNVGDDEDFRWVANLEGPEFHNQQLRIKHLYELKPAIFISSGILYTRQKTDEAFARVSVNSKSSPVPLGRFAHGLNADISCPKGGEVILSNLSEEGSARCFVSLPQCDDTKYLITIENECDEDYGSESTDFRLFYDVLEDPEERKFDLRRVVEAGCYGAPEHALKERGDFVLDGYPQNCFTVTIGR